MVAVATSTTLYVEYDVDLNQWQAQFAEAAAHLEKNQRGGSGFSFELKTAYPVKIKAAKPIKSPRGDVQLQMDMAVQSDAGEDATEIGRTREWATIMYQASDMQPDQDQQAVVKRHIARKRDMRVLFSAADPETFALYARRVPKVTKGFDYYDFQNKLMDSEAFEARKRAVEGALDEAMTRLHEGIDLPIDGFEGAMLYLVKVPHAKEGRKPHTNFFIEQPETYPLATAGEEHAF